MCDHNRREEERLDNEVPPRLYKKIDTLSEPDEYTFYGDLSGFLVGVEDIDLPETCPDCGREFVPTSIHTVDDGALVVIRLVCEVPGDRVSTYVYDATAGELYFEQNTRLEQE